MKPKIRFKGFEGEWKEYSLGEVGSIYSGIGFPECEQGGRSGIPFYKVSDMNNQGNESIMHSSNNYVSDKQIQRNHWKICSETPAIFFAKVGAAVMLNRKRIVLEPCLCDNNTMMFSLSKDKWSTNFALPLFNNVDFPSLAQVGSLPSFNGSQVKEIKVKLPKFEEQEMVGKYFTSLDSQISASTSRLASLKQMKAASLQAMFPQEGETVPKIRFKGFEGEWKKVKFSELYERSSIKNDLSFGTDKIISVANMYFIKNSRQVDDDYLRSYNIMRLGDIAFEGNKSKNFAHGRLVENTIGDGIVSHVFIVMKPISKNYDLNFWKYYINNENIMGNILVRSTKSSTMMTDLVVDDFLKESILVPSYEEQIEIGKILTSLDRQISLQSQRLEKLKQIKSACLDKMFV